MKVNQMKQNEKKKKKVKKIKMPDRETGRLPIKIIITRTYSLT